MELRDVSFVLLKTNVNKLLQGSHLHLGIHPKAWHDCWFIFNDTLRGSVIHRNQDCQNHWQNPHFCTCRSGISCINSEWNIKGWWCKSSHMEKCMHKWEKSHMTIHAFFCSRVGDDLIGSLSNYLISKWSTNIENQCRMSFIILLYRWVQTFSNSTGISNSTGLWGQGERNNTIRRIVLLPVLMGLFYLPPEVLAPGVGVGTGSLQTPLQDSLYFQTKVRNSQFLLSWNQKQLGWFFFTVLSCLEVQGALQKELQVPCTPTPRRPELYGISKKKTFTPSGSMILLVMLRPLLPSHPLMGQRQGFKGWGVVMTQFENLCISFILTLRQSMKVLFFSCFAPKFST